MLASYPSLDSMDLPSSAEIILPNGMPVTTVEEKEDKEETYESLWADKEPLKVDWDKPICPEHKVACKGKLCTVMAKIERDKKREEERKKERGVDDGWSSVRSSSKNRGRKSKFYVVLFDSSIRIYRWAWWCIHSQRGQLLG